MMYTALCSIEVKLGFISINCSNIFNNIIDTLHVSAHDGHYRKTINISNEMLGMYCMHLFFCKG
jgi:hypothetical protein